MANMQADLPGVYQRPKCAYCGRAFKLPGAQGRYCNNTHFEAALLQQLNAEQEARKAAQAAVLKAVTRRPGSTWDHPRARRLGRGRPIRQAALETPAG